MKQLIFLFTSVFLILQLFVSSAGVVLDHHHCSKDGDSFHLFFSHEETCGNHLSAQVINTNELSCGMASSCCSAAQEPINNVLTIEEPACCSTDLYHFQLDTDLASNDIGFDQPVILERISTFFQPLQTTIRLTYAFNYRGPPAPTTKQKLAQLQSYLI